MKKPASVHQQTRGGEPGSSKQFHHSLCKHAKKKIINQSLSNLISPEDATLQRCCGARAFSSRRPREAVQGVLCGGGWQHLLHLLLGKVWWLASTWWVIDLCLWLWEVCVGHQMLTQPTRDQTLNPQKYDDRVLERLKWRRPRSYRSWTEPVAMWMCNTAARSFFNQFFIYNN